MRKPTFERLRQVILLVNEFGADATQAIDDAGYGSFVHNHEILVLMLALERGEIRPRDVIVASGLTSGGVANLLARLEAQRLLVRTYGRVDGDRRSAAIRLTRRGEQTADGIMAAVEESIRSQSERLLRLGALLTAPGTSFEPPSRTLRGETPPTENLRCMAALGGSIVVALRAAAPDDQAPEKSTIVLAMAAADAPVRPRQLTHSTGLSSGGVSQLLDRLESNGLITRTSGRLDDRRAVVVELTDVGRVELERRLGAVHEHLPVIRVAFTDLLAVAPV